MESNKSYQAFSMQAPKPNRAQRRAQKQQQERDRRRLVRELKQQEEKRLQEERKRQKQISNADHLIYVHPEYMDRYDLGNPTHDDSKPSHRYVVGVSGEVTSHEPGYKYGEESNDGSN